MTVQMHQFDGPESQSAAVSNKRVEPNRRPALPLDAGWEFERVICAPPSLSAAVAHLVRQLQMRSDEFIILSLGIVLAGCRPQGDSPTRLRSQEVPAVATNVLAATNVVPSIAGTWHWLDEEMVIDLSPNGHWRWWKLEEQSGSSSEPPSAGGRWFIHEQALYLRVEQASKSAGHGVSPNLAMVFEIKSVAPDTLLLSWSLPNEEEITWRRIAEQGGPAEGRRPLRSETNRTSETPVSRR